MFCKYIFKYSYLQDDLKEISTVNLNRLKIKFDYVFCEFENLLIKKTLMQKVKKIFQTALHQS